MKQLIDHKEIDVDAASESGILEASGLEELWQKLCSAGCYVAYGDDR